MDCDVIIITDFVLFRFLFWRFLVNNFEPNDFIRDIVESAKNKLIEASSRREEKDDVKERQVEIRRFGSFFRWQWIIFDHDLQKNVFKKRNLCEKHFPWIVGKVRWSTNKLVVTNMSSSEPASISFMRIIIRITANDANTRSAITWVIFRSETICIFICHGRLVR